MYLLRRSATLGDARRVTTSLVAPGFRAYLVEASGIRFDSSVIHAAFPMITGTQIAFQLSGQLHLYDRNQTLEDRSWMVEPTFSWRERWEGGDFCVVLLEWSRAIVVKTPSMNSSRVLTALASALASALRRSDAVDAEVNCLPPLLTALKADGLELPPIPPTPQLLAHRRAVAVLNMVRTRLDHQPQWIDAADSGWSERQLRRDISAFFTAMDMPNLGLRALLVRERLGAAVSLLGARHRIDDTARAVGYASSTALGIALARNGLPSATELKRHIIH
jgi:hypothetical protein